LIKKTKKEGKDEKEKKMKSSICITTTPSSDASSRVRTFATNWSSFTVVYSHKDNDVYTKYDFSESVSVYDIVDKFANELCSFCLFEEGTYNMWTATFDGSGIIAPPVHRHMKDGDSIVFANSVIEYV